ncbi:hypothetical protein DCAR_0727982 [Daucus carota subsp. sativus]|uniref:Myb-like domain-containing protein n=2 Tax=Daucus carota subsp. sativus TaxID=79200 RepID=A0AAF1B9S9_DAUCS|nr:hypothetical protein DCAR_0727982 [Daucus carota subsp. sativus]
MSVWVGESDVVGKSGKKGKRSQKIEKGGEEEVRDHLDVEEGGIVKSGKKGKRSKKKEMDGVEEETDRMDVVEDGIGNSRKKGKKKEMDGVGEVMDCLDMEEDGIENSRKKGRKSKNKEMDGVGEVTDCMDVEEDGIGKSRKKGEKSKEKDGAEEMNDQTNVENDRNLESTVENKKKKNKGNDMVAGGESMTDPQDKEYKVEKRKKKKKTKTFENQDALNKKTETEAKERNNIAGNVEKKKKKRKRTVEEEDDNDKGQTNGCYGEDHVNSLPDDNGMVTIGKVKMMEKKKKRQRKNEEITEKDGLLSKAKDNETTNVSGKDKTKSVNKDPENPKSKVKKKVRFSNDLEVFPSNSLVQGKRFTPEEDEKLRAAVKEYIQSHCLGEKGVEMVMNCISHRQVRNCWNEINKALPYRPKSAIYCRAHTLFERGETHEWTEEEKEMLLEQYKKHGNNWKLMAKEFKRHRLQVKDTYRRIKRERNRGHWSQEEYQTLFDNVNIDLRAKLDEEKKSKHGMLRDNICWTAISDKLSTRADSLCCMKWYNQLTSPMVAQGIWADSDDYRLLDALFNLDACCIEDVDWDDLMDHRSGDVCRKRWDQMVLHIGLHGVKSFSEQVEVLAKRYRPELTEAREAWDSKPLVP